MTAAVLDDATAVPLRTDWLALADLLRRQSDGDRPDTPDPADPRPEEAR